MNAACFETRQAFTQRCDRGGVRMADGDGPALAPCVRRRAIELQKNRCTGLDVVKKLRAAKRCGNTVAFGGCVGDSFDSGAAIYEK